MDHEKEKQLTNLLAPQYRVNYFLPAKSYFKIHDFPNKQSITNLTQLQL